MGSQKRALRSEVTSKPLVYDGDTGGLPEIFRYAVRSLEDLGVSACIIEDKSGPHPHSPATQFDALPTLSLIHI